MTCLSSVGILEVGAVHKLNEGEGVGGGEELEMVMKEGGDV